MMNNPAEALEGAPISPAPCVHRSPSDLLYLSNGVIGLAVGQDPLQDSACLVNGYAQPHPVGGFETSGGVPCPLGVRFTFDDDGYAPPYRFEAERWTLDFGTGELRVEGRVATDGRGFACRLTLWCPRSLPHAVVQELEFDEPAIPHAEVRLAGVLGERIAGVEGAVHWRAPGGDRIGLATAGRREGGRWVQMAAAVPARRHPRPDLQARRVLDLALARSADRLREENRRAWDELWSRRVAAPYPDGQAAVDAALFYLNASVHAASPNSTGLCGLCPPVFYHNFHQHLFWDLETHALPALLLTQPEAARALLEARFRGLDRARDHAAVHGYRGAQFPWEAGVEGQEELPLEASAMLHEQHVSLCVAEGFARAAEQFGPVFLRERAWPVLAGVAEWLESRVEFDGAGAHLRHVIGISEQMAPHDDNVWTNALARRVLRRAAAAHRALGYGEAERWADLAGRIVLPIEDGVLVPHPGHRMSGEFCPEPAMVLFPLGERLPPGVAEATLRATLKPALQTLGMPMHSPYHWVWGKLAGDEAHARRTFEQGVLSFVHGPFHLIDEFGSPFADAKRRVGPYLAHCGGIVQGALWSAGRAAAP